MTSLVNLFFLTINKYGYKLLLQILFFELINFYRLRFYDYVTENPISVNYEPCVPSPYFLLNCVNKNIYKKKSIFIDFGCGKGRALNYFRIYNFKKLIGIENNLRLKKYLCKINDSKVDILFQDCTNNQFINDLAIKYQSENLILYFYHPFSEKILNIIISFFLKKREKSLEIVILGKIKISKYNLTKYSVIKKNINNMLKIYKFSL